MYHMKTRPHWNETNILCNRIVGNTVSIFEVLFNNIEENIDMEIEVNGKLEEEISKE